MIPCTTYNLAAMYGRLLRQWRHRIAARALTLDAACAAVGADATVVTSRRRDMASVRQRRSVWRWFRAQKPEPLSYPAIGSITGHDHTSVMVGVRGGKRRRASSI